MFSLFELPRGVSIKIDRNPYFGALLLLLDAMPDAFYKVLR